MSRTPNPNIEVTSFASDQAGVIATWKTVSAGGLGRDAMRDSASAAVSATATNWEWFRSEWHKKAICIDASSYRTSLVSKIETLLGASQDGKKLIASLTATGVNIEVSLPRQPKVGDVRKIVDPSDGNITFRNRKESDRIADSHLSATYAAYPKSLTYNDWLVIEVMISVRNALAHSSPRSIDAMNACLNACLNTGDPQIQALGRVTNRVTRSGIGSYLVADPKELSGERRVGYLCDYILKLGSKFKI